MFQNIALNLKDEGQFVAVTPHSTEDPNDQAEKRLALRPSQDSGITIKVLRHIPNGVATHLEAPTKAGMVEFDTNHPRKKVYEDSARAGGLSGALEWKSVLTPDHDDIHLPSVAHESWETYRSVPHCSILSIAKY